MTAALQERWKMPLFGNADGFASIAPDGIQAISGKASSSGCWHDTCIVNAGGQEARSKMKTTKRAVDEKGRGNHQAVQAG
ncbi:hypothetical protein [Jiella mangrovi]|uniref:Uncharacterized protein n=1 Tax=Jiella mangrovi TaxID=2821407 RepID=A0ABS4BEN2_9HYPH|nr:hypothetical protein [Jiella mangrovi]MBP0615206.1 hypothetical protein [Jiella mangrovi]